MRKDKLYDFLVRAIELYYIDYLNRFRQLTKYRNEFYPIPDEFKEITEFFTTTLRSSNQLNLRSGYYLEASGFDNGLGKYEGCFDEVLELPPVVPDSEMDPSFLIYLERTRDQGLVQGRFRRQ